MKKLTALILMILVAGMIIFATWQLFRGNLEAAFSILPLLVVTYFFLRLQHK